jgi:hypothetical protein
VNLVVTALAGIVLSHLLALTGALLYSLPVMWLWNAVAPDVFGMQPLAWVKALWLGMVEQRMPSRRGAEVEHQ